MREGNWFYAQAPVGVLRRPVRLKARFALSTRGLRHRVIDAEAAWRNGEVRYAGRWLCGDGGTNITLLPDDSDAGRPCTRCAIRDSWPAANVVYRFFDVDGLVYIGSTGSLGDRLYAHMLRSPWWTPALRLEVTTYDSLPLARGAESKAIHAENPRENVIHNQPRRPQLVACS